MAFPGKGSEERPEFGRVLRGTHCNNLFGPGLTGEGGNDGLDLVIQDRNHGVVSGGGPGSILLPD